MAVTDHISFAGVNPLFGETGDGRFVDMVDAYDPRLVEQILLVARQAGIACHSGVYVWFSGPSFETPAEIRAARTLGADAVGMSTVPETILARWAGLRVAALSLITNYAAGLGGDKLGHEQTLAVARESEGRMRRLLRLFIEQYA
jgi:inosine/guanosine/xanthosine phosphorylase family protein